ncbi:hypothetical protein AAFF_G00280900 [Aldrovandia affinis]|uniref:L1 transposable element RRM domain-containing protein n=1 Tax=Aldrovandia affinis TaxID=143900 RepID=A0AAD7RAC4_9TELE|nr:hypothetical protein AAFF_G00280900 [Aldrovandia affinis]
MADAQSSNDESAETMRSVLHRISKEIRDFRAEHKEDLHKLQEELKEDMKTELKDLKQEIYRELSANSTRIQAHETRLNEAETRIDEGETINMAMKDALIKSIKEQKAMREKLVDLEGRSRRNNIRIYGVPEEKEGNSMSEYVETLLKTELDLADTNLQIQRAHRVLARKPERNAPPRSIVVNFLEFNIKEMVLKKAWGKKIMIEERRLSFDHDYATDVVQKRKAYTGIKRALKEKGVHFQTPLDKMRIHWDSGTRTYNSAQDAAQELRRRGYSVETPGRSTTELDPEVERLLQAKIWERAGEGNEDGSGTARRARRRLQEFERIPPN